MSHPEDGYLGFLFDLLSPFCSRFVAARIIGAAAGFLLGYSTSRVFWNLPFVVSFMRSLEGEGGTEISSVANECTCPAETNQS